MDHIDAKNFMRLTLVRHGQSMGNLEGRMQGQQDWPLSPLGREQAAAAGKRYAGRQPDRILTSPLIRARETGEIVFPGREMSAEPGFMEVCEGDWEGRPIKEIMTREPQYLTGWFQAGSGIAAPGGETVEALYGRVTEALLRRLAEAQQDGIKDLFIFSHYCAIMAMVGCLTRGGIPSMLHIATGNACGVHFMISGDIAVLVGMDLPAEGQ